MKSWYLRLCSMVLTITLIINLLPAQAIAGDAAFDSEKEISAPQNDIQPEQGASIYPISEETAAATIVAELDNLRTENSKSFLLSNGLKMSVFYAETVHYDDDGQWKEIDNSLQAIGSDSNGHFTNRAGRWNVSFPQQIGDGKWIAINDANYSLKFGLAGEIRSNLSIAADDKANASNRMEQVVSSVNAVSGVICENETTHLQTDTGYAETYVDNLSSKLRYDGVYANTDIEYTIGTGRIKESVIIKSYDSGLQGYHYLLQVGDLCPVLEADNSISLYDGESDNVVMTMPAPFMVDSMGEVCTDIDVTLKCSGDVYLLSYGLPLEWMASEERAWPVILDPVIEGSSALYTQMTFKSVIEGYGGNHIFKIIGKDSGSIINEVLKPGLHCGYHSITRRHRTYCSFSGIPTVGADEIIVNASLSLTVLEGTLSATPVEIHRVTSPWSIDIDWNHQPTFDAKVESCTYVTDSGVQKVDITPLFKNAYSGNWYGFVMKTTDEIESGDKGRNGKEFYDASSNYNIGLHPVITITTAHISGIEDYWNYTEHSVGNAGASYVNNAYGNLVVAKTDMGFDGNRMPVSISHIYNSVDYNKDIFGLGNGWRTNYNQRILPYSITTQSTDTVLSNYIWEDADGTEHHFIRNGSSGYDTDNLGLTMQFTGGGYTITDLQGNVSTFDSNGRLIRIENNKAVKSCIEISYVSDDENDFRIATVQDGGERIYSFHYNTARLLESIQFHGQQTDGTSFATVSYSYSSGNMTRITESDGTYYEYLYSGNRLSRVVDHDGYYISYAYDSSGRVTKLTEFQQTDYEAVEGGHVDFTYAHKQTRIEDHKGNETLIRFNDWGDAVYYQDKEGRAIFTNYSANHYTEIENKHRVSEESNLQTTTANLIENNSFENTRLPCGWITTNTSVSCEYSDDCAVIGEYALKIGDSEAMGATQIRGPAFEAVEGRSYTFSAYLCILAGSAYIQMSDNSASVTSSVEAATDGWVRVNVTYTNNSGGNKTVTPSLVTSDNTIVYMDCVQIERSLTATRFNLVNNGDFNNPLDNHWVKSGVGNIYNSNHVAHEALDKAVYYLPSSFRSPFTLQQDIKISGTAGNDFVFAFWFRQYVSADLNGDLENSPNVRLAFTGKDENDRVCTYYTEIIPMCPGQNDAGIWKYVAKSIVAPCDYTSVAIIFSGGNRSISTDIDGVQLYRERLGATYTYDAEGRVISSTNILGLTTQYQYNQGGSNNSGNDLVKVVQSSGVTSLFYYDDFHNLEYESSTAGPVIIRTFDSYGNVLTEKGYVDERVTLTTYTYTSDGNYLARVCDVQGNAMEYGYDPDTGMLLWAKGPGDTDATKTTYEYDSMFRVEEIQRPYNSSELSVRYGYENGRLTTLTSPTTVYTFSYGDFGLRNSVKIGENVIAEYAYTDQNHQLSRIDYGNKDSVQYHYNQENVVDKITYEDNTSDYFSYDNQGRPISCYSDANDHRISYSYDSYGRPSEYLSSYAGIDYRCLYHYDASGRISDLVHKRGNAGWSVSYGYDNKDRLATQIFQDLTRTYTYDGLNRITGWLESSEYSTNNICTYEYRSLGADNSYTDGLISRYTLSIQTYRLVLDFQYDAKGNIISVTDGANTTTYVYDTAGQLIRENNPVAGRTWIWTYDNGGNIRSRKEYAYTVGTVGTCLDTIAYGYNDTAWGDLLTAYDGRNYYYDGIGNLVDDGVWNYTWEHGRQLASMTGPGGTWNYHYDANGLRYRRDSGAQYYSYTYNGDQLVHMKHGADTVSFVYDAQGRPAYLIFNGNRFYYACNLQGDVVAILNSSGNKLVTYTYDAWGKVLSIGGSMSATLGQLNPLRYRGYVYDQETGLYYVSSRYYDPEIGRWINADGQLTTGSDLTGLNLFAYCGNNPVNRIDPTGEAWWHWALGAAVVAVAAVATVVTCGGFAAAATAVCMVGSGVAAATTASTVAAGAFIGSATVYGMAVLSAASTSNSVQEFNDQGNWGTVAATAFGGLTGGYDGYTMSKAQASQTVADDDTFLPDSFYSKHAPKQSTPNSSYTNYTYNNYTGKYEKSTAYYDFAGRQNIRIDWTNHGYSNHGNPHVHYTTYNSQYRDGFTIRWD